MRFRSGSRSLPSGLEGARRCDAPKGKPLKVSEDRAELLQGLGNGAGR
jgi:hypothetical protein